MAACEEWFVGEDGCLSVGQPTTGLTYHSNLNTVLVTTKEPSIKVVDVTSGSILQSSNLSGKFGIPQYNFHCHSFRANFAIGDDYLIILPLQISTIHGK